MNHHYLFTRLALAVLMLISIAAVRKTLRDRAAARPLAAPWTSPDLGRRRRRTSRRRTRGPRGQRPPRPGAERLTKRRGRLLSHSRDAPVVPVYLPLDSPPDVTGDFHGAGA